MPFNTMGHKYYAKGREALGEGRAEDGIEALKLAEINFKRDYDNLMLIKTMNLLAVAYSITANDRKMAEAISDGLKYCTQFGFRGAKNMFYNGLCDRYLSLGDFEDALTYGKMTVENLENFGSEFDNPPGAYMVAYLNLAYAYMKTEDYINAELFLNKAIEAAHENDIHNHDYSFNSMMCTIKHIAGDDQYVKDHTKDLLSITMSTDITITDYIQDIQLAVEVLIFIGDCDSAMKLADTVFESLFDNPNLNIRMEVSKLYMKIYLALGEREKYYEACDLYITDDSAVKDAKAMKSLEVFKNLKI